MAVSEADKEAAKLTATYVNGFAIAVSAIGGLAPIVSSLYAAEPVPLSPWQIAGISSVCILFSIAIHLLARRYLIRELNR